MPDCTALSERDILAIHAGEPERLFSGPAEARAEFVALAGIWHPDRHASGNAAVFAHLAELWAEAERRIAAGLWMSPGLAEFTATDGRRFRFKYRRRHEFELGFMLIGRRRTAYFIEKRFSPLAESAARTLQDFTFADSGMKEEMGPALPLLRARTDTADHHIFVMDKAEDLIALADVQAHLGGRIDARGTAWILSSLLNLACYLQWARIAHQAIDRQTVFISPERHSAALPGGWWYAAREGTHVTSLPARSVSVMPPDLRSAREAGNRLDLELIRLTGRELLGDATGIGLLSDSTVPTPMAEWLIHPAAATALEDYENWQLVLDASFGPRKFAPMRVCADVVYTDENQ